MAVMPAETVLRYLEYVEGQRRVRRSSMCVRAAAAVRGGGRKCAPWGRDADQTCVGTKCDRVT